MGDFKCPFFCNAREVIKKIFENVFYAEKVKSLERNSVLDKAAK